MKKQVNLTLMFAIVDIETTGYNNPCNNITEIAIVLHDGKHIVDSFHSLINPNTPINPYVSRLTGITNEMVRDAPSFGEVANKIWSMTENAVFVAHSVNFDYYMLRTEFKSFGVDFKRKKLCTVRLSRKIFPGYISYSLGNICSSLGIVISDRHRAMGDAQATVKLLEKCIHNDTENIISKSLQRNSKEAIIPPHLDKEIFEKLPGETGVYYFHNQAGKVIYVGKAINIKQRIYSHFTQSSNHKISFLNEIHDISCTITGSELVALLLESDEIKKLYPLYNSAQKRSEASYCLFEYFDKKDIHHLQIGRAFKNIEPLISFNSLEEARSYTFRLIEKYDLCPKCCGIQVTSHACFDYQLKKCRGVCADQEKIADYNKRVQKAIKKMKSEMGDLILTDRGRKQDEKAIVVIEKGRYKGFGFVDNDTSINTIEDAHTYISSYKDNNDIQKILRVWINKRGVG